MKLYTIGHSNHTIAEFIQLLNYYNINCIIDVRSVPASRYCHHFNKNAIRTTLESNDIKYAFLGDGLGGRQKDINVLDDNSMVDFEKVQQTSSFKQSIKYIQSIISNKKNTIAIMCSEGDPLKCHRFSMISPCLIDVGIEVDHILKDYTVKSQDELKVELAKRYKENVDIYKQHNKEIGYVHKNE